MNVTFDNVTITITADSPQRAHALLGRALSMLNITYTTDTYSVDGGEDIDTAELWPETSAADNNHDPQLYACGNCDWIGPKSDMRDIRDYAERVAAGEPEPAGECPMCWGALCHPAEPGAVASRIDPIHAAQHYMDKSDDPGHGPGSDCDVCVFHLTGTDKGRK